jgi:hypothetical protein
VFVKPRVVENRAVVIIVIITTTTTFMQGMPEINSVSRVCNVVAVV